VPQAFALAAEMVATPARLVELALSPFVPGLIFSTSRPPESFTRAPESRVARGPGVLQKLCVMSDSGARKIRAGIEALLAQVTAPDLQIRCPASGRRWSVAAIVVSVSRPCASSPAFVQHDKLLGVLPNAETQAICHSIPRNFVMDPRPLSGARAVA
jgi:hypothetical protein